jgi:membrane-bound lytic murein transglycosylase MltF
MLSAIAGAVTIWFALAAVSALGIGALMNAAKIPRQQLATNRNWTERTQD